MHPQSLISVPDPGPELDPDPVVDAELDPGPDEMLSRSDRYDSTMSRALDPFFGPPEKVSSSMMSIDLP